MFSVQTVKSVQVQVISSAHRLPTPVRVLEMNEQCACSLQKYIYCVKCVLTSVCVYVYVCRLTEKLLIYTVCVCLGSVWISGQLGCVSVYCGWSVCV